MKKRDIHNIPLVTTDQMREVDRLMVDMFGIQLIQMMENAGANLARLTLHRYSNRLHQGEVILLCGTGNNGGGGMAAARHLHNRGIQTGICLVGDEDHLKDIPELQWRIIKNLGIPVLDINDLKGASLLIDCMIGYGLRGNPREPISNWILAVNETGLPVLSLDTPSGLDATEGIPGNQCILSDATLTLALPKTGLVAQSAQKYVGDLFLADIGVPPELYLRMGMTIGNIFDDDTVIWIGD